jgi:hypothetical protein
MASGFTSGLSHAVMKSRWAQWRRELEDPVPGGMNLTPSSDEWHDGAAGLLDARRGGLEPQFISFVEGILAEERGHQVQRTPVASSNHLLPHRQDDSRGLPPATISLHNSGDRNLTTPKQQHNLTAHSSNQQQISPISPSVDQQPQHAVDDHLYPVPSNYEAAKTTKTAPTQHQLVIINAFNLATSMAELNRHVKQAQADSLWLRCAQATRKDDHEKCSNLVTQMRFVNPKLAVEAERRSAQLRNQMQAQAWSQHQAAQPSETSLNTPKRDKHKRDLSGNPFTPLHSSQRKRSRSLATGADELKSDKVPNLPPIDKIQQHPLGRDWYYVCPDNTVCRKHLTKHDDRRYIAGGHPTRTLEQHMTKWHDIQEEGVQWRRESGKLAFKVTAVDFENKRWEGISLQDGTLFRGGFAPYQPRTNVSDLSRDAESEEHYGFEDTDLRLPNSRQMNRSTTMPLPARFGNLEAQLAVQTGNTGQFTDGTEYRAISSPQGSHHNANYVRQPAFIAEEPAWFQNWEFESGRQNSENQSLGWNTQPNLTESLGRHQVHENLSSPLGGLQPGLELSNSLQRFNDNGILQSVQTEASRFLDFTSSLQQGSSVSTTAGNHPSQTERSTPNQVGHVDAPGAAFGITGAHRTDGEFSQINVDMESGARSYQPTENAEGDTHDQGPV